MDLEKEPGAHVPVIMHSATQAQDELTNRSGKDNS